MEFMTQTRYMRIIAFVIFVSQKGKPTEVPACLEKVQHFGKEKYQEIRKKWDFLL